MNTRNIHRRVMAVLSGFAAILGAALAAFSIWLILWIGYDMGLPM